MTAGVAMTHHGAKNGYVQVNISTPMETVRHLNREAAGEGLISLSPFVLAHERDHHTLNF
jgi:hypothetical protein